MTRGTGLLFDDPKHWCAAKPGKEKAEHIQLENTGTVDWHLSSTNWKNMFLVN